MGHLAGIGLVWGAVFIYAASNSIVSLLITVGEQNPVEGRNPISFCNVLFIGNLAALVALIFIFGRDWTRKNLKGLSAVDWSALTISAILSSAVSPSLFFFALEHTKVTNVVLIGRIEPPLILLLSALFLSEKLDRWALAGSLVAVVGAAVVVLGQEGDARLGLGVGELSALGASLSFAASTTFSKWRLKHIPMGIFAIYRTAFGTVVFFVAAIYLFGIGHFQDAFRPIVWQYVAVYGAVIVVLGTLFWNFGLKWSRSSDVSLAASFSPVAGVAFAILLVNEPMTANLFLGGSVVIAGIVLGQFGCRLTEGARKRFAEIRSRKEAATGSGAAMEQEGGIGFKGV